jgi:hypothetical protein
MMKSFLFIRLSLFCMETFHQREKQFERNCGTGSSRTTILNIETPVDLEESSVPLILVYPVRPMYIHRVSALKPYRWCHEGSDCPWNWKPVNDG